jgi:hypothetical protein
LSLASSQAIMPAVSSRRSWRVMLLRAARIIRIIASPRLE